jgi:hypothetical protein
MPPMNPAETSTIDSIKRRSMASAYVDAARAAVSRFRDRHRQDAVLQIGGDVRNVDALGQREGAREAAVAALDAVILLARDLAVGRGRARAANGDAIVVRVDVDLIARQPGSSAVSTNSFAVS